MFKKILSILFISFISLFFLTIPVNAKVLPRFAGVSKNGGKPTSSGVIVSPKLRGDRKAIAIYFGNLSKVNNISYTLTYQGNGIDQGAIGSVDPSAGAPANRELLFGTCSSGVCTYHSAISNMKLEVTVELTSGKRMVRRYRIKV